MDKRLKLNRKQQALVKKLAKVFGELRKENVGILTDWNNEWGACDFEGLYFYNNAEVLETDIFEPEGSTGYNEGYSEESSWSIAGEGEIWYTPKPEDLDYLHLDLSMDLTYDNWFSVLLEKTEETDIFYRKQEKAKKLAPLTKELEKLKEEMRKYETAANECEDSIHRLEEKGVSQEIIDEEKANLESNKKQVEALQKQIDKVNSEIRKVKAIKVNK